MTATSFLSTLAREIRFWQWQRQARRHPHLRRPGAFVLADETDSAVALVRRSRPAIDAVTARRLSRDRLGTKAS
jgi:hypothetical protein